MSNSTDNNDNDSARYHCKNCKEDVLDLGCCVAACISSDRWVYKSKSGSLLVTPAPYLFFDGGFSNLAQLLPMRCK